jgi:hypothetical protein
MFDCNASSSEKWQLIRSTSTVYPYQFRNVLSGRCLTAAASPGNPGIGRYYFMYACQENNPYQRFETQVALSGGTFILYINDPTGNGDILVDEYQTTCCANGSPVGNFTFTNHPLQRWNFIPA